jgi:hypothetical protein
VAHDAEQRAEFGFASRIDVTDFAAVTLKDWKQLHGTATSLDQAGRAGIEIKNFNKASFVMYVIGSVYSINGDDGDVPGTLNIMKIPVPACSDIRVRAVWSTDSSASNPQDYRPGSAFFTDYLNRVWVRKPSALPRPLQGRSVGDGPGEWGLAAGRQAKLLLDPMSKDPDLPRVGAHMYSSADLGSCDSPATGG